MATRRLTGSRPGRARRPKRVRFRSKRGARSHGGSVFRAHRGHRKGGVVFRAHAGRAMTIRRARPARPWKAPKRAAYRAAGRHRGFPARHRAKAYKAAGRRLPVSWVRARKHPARFRAARARRAP